jgi:hypothetical protein
VENLLSVGTRKKFHCVVCQFPELVYTVNVYGHEHGNGLIHGPGYGLRHEHGNGHRHEYGHGQGHGHVNTVDMDTHRGW